LLAHKINFLLLLIAMILHSVGWAQERGAIRNIHWQDLSPELQRGLMSRQLSAQNFTAFIDAIQQQTTVREINGEFDHLIYYILQSQQFTALPKIEPALSAYDFVQTLSLGEREKYLASEKYFPSHVTIPKAVTARLKVFLQRLTQAQSDERMRYFKQFLATTQSASLERLTDEYARAMKFLYRKEFLTRSIGNPSGVAAYVASLYQERGHSTDTQIEANFVLSQALAMIKATAPATRLNRILIVGPGLDFAPRTDLMDVFGPQCYQPFAVADALLLLQLSAPATLQIHCVDINNRVVSFLRDFPSRQNRTLTIFSGLANDQNHQLTDDYQSYFRSFGAFIGNETASPSDTILPNHLRRSVRINSAIASRITADKLNIITQRYALAPDYDLVIVTNVFPYFNETELALALSNIAAMMRPGAFLLHNEPRPLPANAVGLPLQQARTILLAKGQRGELFDGIAIHQKCPTKC
jgi:CheR methyltransferase, SAM binding domain